LIAGSVTVAVGSWFAWVRIGVVLKAEAPDASRYQRYVILDTPLGSLIVPRAPVSARSVSATVGVIEGAPVTGCCAGAAVALPVSANVCVPAAFVATRFADFAPAGASGLN